MTTCGEQGGVNARGDPCARASGWGVPGSAAGLCMHHREARPRAKGADAPEPPAGLSAEAATAWRAVLGDWVLDPAEGLILWGALEAWDTYRSARELVLKEGVVVDGKRHPAALVMRDSFAAFRTGVAQLGLEAIARDNDTE